MGTAYHRQGCKPLHKQHRKPEPRRGDRIILLIICRPFGALVYLSSKQGITPLPVIFQSFGLLVQSNQIFC